MPCPAAPCPSRPRKVSPEPSTGRPVDAARSSYASGVGRSHSRSITRIVANTCSMKSRNVVCCPRGRRMQLTQDGARALMLAAQGLLEPPERVATKADLLDTIRRMGVLQIDTIHVVA